MNINSPPKALPAILSRAIRIAAIVCMISSAIPSVHARGNAHGNARGWIPQDARGRIDGAPGHPPASARPELAQHSPSHQTPPGEMTCSRLIETGIDSMEAGRLEEARDIFSEAAGSSRCSVIGRQVAQTHEYYTLFFLQETIDSLHRIHAVLMKTGTDNISRRAMEVYRNRFLQHEFKHLTAIPWLEAKEFLFKKNFGILRVRGEGLNPEMEERLAGLAKTFHYLIEAEEQLNPPGMTLIRVKKTNVFLAEASRRIETLAPSDTATVRAERARLSNRLLPFEEAIKKYNGLVEPFKTDPTRWAEACQNLERERADWMDNLPGELRREYGDLLAGFEKVKQAEQQTDPFLKLDHYQNARADASREPTLSAFVDRRIRELQARIDIAGGMYQKLLAALGEEDERKARNILNGLGDAFMIYLNDREPQHTLGVQGVFKDIDEGDALMRTPDASDQQLKEARRLYESARSKSTSLEDASGEIHIAWLPEQRLIKRRRLAIFPWRVNADVSIFTPLVLNTIVDFFEHNKQSRFFIKSSFYDIEITDGVRTIEPIVIDGHDRDLLWESLSNVDRDPNMDKIRELGRELKVDAVLMVDFRIREKGVYVGAEVLHLYVIDVETNTLFYVKNRARIAAYMGDLKNELVALLGELMRQYAASSPEERDGDR